MANPNRDLIVDDLVADLAAINGLSPYTVTVAKVTRNHEVGSQIPTHFMPYVGVKEGDENYAPAGFGLFKVRFPIEILLQVQSGTEDGAKTLLNNLYDDVLHACVVGHTRGGFSYDTKITRTSPTEMVDRTIARMVAEFEVLYTRGFAAGT